MVRTIYLICILLFISGIYSYCGIPNSYLTKGVPRTSTGGNSNTKKDDTDITEASKKRATEDDTPLMPYEMVNDTIAFMTCDFDNADIPTLFVGALRDKSGIRIRSDLTSSIDKYRYHRSKPTLVFTKDNLGRDNYTFISGHTDVTNNFSIDSLNYSSDELKKNKDTFLNIFKEQPLEARVLIGNSGAATSRPIEKLTKPLEKNQILIGFKDSKSNLAGFINTEGRVQAFGSFLNVQLNREGSYFVLDDVTETYFPNRDDKETIDWSCPKSLKLNIRRNSKYANSPEKRCDIGDDSSSGNYKLVRSILGDDWNINLEENCISLKESNSYCYRMTYRLRSRPDGRGTVEEDKSKCSDDDDAHCPHFLSVCKRGS